jgi:serine/threonine-protein kinase
VPPGFVAIHGGPTWLGGDPEAGGSSHGREERAETFFIARVETTIDDYARFVESVLPDHPDQTTTLLPRFNAGRSALAEWKEGRLVLAPSMWKDDGGVYSRSLGLYCVKLEQIRRYCAWRTAELGDDEWEFDLPTAAEWERAARGADGRRFPWGDEFDWTFAKNAFASPLSARGTPIPEPGGLFPVDASPFGVLDMAANMRELALEQDGSWRLRGASWGLSESNAFHCASRSSFGEVNLGQSGLGFRLVLRRKKA